MIRSALFSLLFVTVIPLLSPGQVTGSQPAKLGSIFGRQIGSVGQRDSNDRYKNDLLDRYKQGDREAAYLLGRISENDAERHRGASSNKYYSQALGWYTLAARSGYEPAGLSAVDLLTTGKCPIQNREQVLPLVQWAAKRNNQNAIRYLGPSYHEGPRTYNDLAKSCTEQYAAKYPDGSVDARGVGFPIPVIRARQATIPDCAEVQRQGKILDQQRDAALRREQRSAAEGLAFLLSAGLANSMYNPQNQRCQAYLDGKPGYTIHDCPAPPSQ